MWTAITLMSSWLASLTSLSFCTHWCNGLSTITDVGCTFLIRTWHVMYYNPLPSGCVSGWLSLKLVMLECTAYGASNLIDDVVIGE